MCKNAYLPCKGLKELWPLDFDLFFEKYFVFSLLQPFVQCAGVHIAKVPKCIKELIPRVKKVCRRSILPGLQI
jgi:hypothetical protein